MKKLLVILLSVAFLLPAKAEPTEKPVNKETINRILSYALENQMIAKAEYRGMINKYGISKPFIKLLKTQEPYIDMINSLFKSYNLKAPNKNWEQTVRIPENVDIFYADSAIKEKNIVEMYKGFLSEEIPDDIRAAVQKLMELSLNHIRLYKFIIEAKTKRPSPSPIR